MYVVGKVIKPHGIKGGIKVYSLMDTPYEFKKLDKVFINNKLYNILSVSATDKQVILLLSNITSIEQAEQLRGAEIFMEKDNAPKLMEGRYYIDDLIGCSVFIDEKNVGSLFDVLQYGSADIYCVNGEKKFMFPFVGNVIKDINILEKKIVLDPKELKKVVVYED